jgi:hypothetical protein
LPTKIEFSRRLNDPGADAIAEYVDGEIALGYRKLAYRCRHYSGAAALVQKVEALAGRTVTQARDVFDLGILIQGGHLPVATKESPLPGIPLAKAIDSLKSLDWLDYEGQVVEFLDPDRRAEYGTREAWESLQRRVFEGLQAHA